jgi:hypothetical protein
MPHLEPCASCACHVKRDDPECPFCGALKALRAEPSERLRRTSRAQWLAFGPSIALAACAGRVASSIAEHDGSAHVASVREAGAVPAALDLAAADVVCPSKSGLFACGSDVCDRAIQACDQGACQWYGSLSDSASCGACPSCDCILASFAGSCRCREDDAGSIAISCGSCYGAPPARLERIA